MAAEKQFENKIKKYLKIRGHWFVKFFANAYTPSGIPDILACIRGRFVAIEVKGGSSYGLTELQKFNLRCIRARGGVAVCVYPSGWEQFAALVEQLEAGEPVEVTEDNYILK